MNGGKVSCRPVVVVVVVVVVMMVVVVVVEVEAMVVVVVVVVVVGEGCTRSIRRTGHRRCWSRCLFVESVWVTIGTLNFLIYLLHGDLKQQL